MKRTKLQRGVVWLCALAVCITGLAFALHNATTALAPGVEIGLADTASGGADIAPIPDAPQDAPTGAVRTDTYFTYDGAPLALDSYFVDGRLYVSAQAFARAVGASMPESWRNTRPAKEIYGDTYISLYDLTQALGLWPVFDSEAREITLCRAQVSATPAPQGAREAAYLRLEDIVADHGASGRFDDAGLEKLRAQADYLYRHGQRYYIAWIPVYVNPQTGVINDLTCDYSFYNAQFLYTLDYMTGHGGTLVAHGLTHQQGDEVSADGTEFGADSPFTDAEIHARMARIREIADTLGYTVDAFEFPHYASTPAQERIAAQYFDVIYQQATDARRFGKIEWETLDGKQVAYLPTPQDYVQSAERRQEMLTRIRDARGLISLFFHPSIDQDCINLYTQPDGVRICHYAPEGFIPQLLALLEAKGRTLAILG